MKQLLLALLVMLVFSHCQKNDTHNRTTIEVSQNPQWTTEPFKTNYTIQFPAGFSGGINGFEGNIFNKKNIADSVAIQYFYSNSLHCFDFRDTLTNLLRPSVQSSFAGTQSIELDQRVEFTSNNSRIGIFYHNSGTPLSYGKLFWKDEGVFKESADVEFRPLRLSLLLDILGTIKNR
jgi:hypothetical protein